VEKENEIRENQKPGPTRDLKIERQNYILFPTNHRMVPTWRKGI
jgi:hypothetical protein